MLTALSTGSAISILSARNSRSEYESWRLVWSILKTATQRNGPEVARDVPEWVGQTENTQVPERVWKRVLDRFEWICQECKRPPWAYKKLECDHIIALVNWTGPLPHGNRESNLQPLCEPCHDQKTGKDVASKAKASRCKAMRPGYKWEKKPSRLASLYAWKKRILAERGGKE